MMADRWDEDWLNNNLERTAYVDGKYITQRSSEAVDKMFIDLYALAS